MRKIILILLLAAGTNVSAQEIDLPQYINHMMENPFVISPSYAGIGPGFQLRLNGISQWVGVKDAPDTQSLTAEYRFRDQLGGGVVLFNDSNGFTKQSGLKGSMAYHLMLSDFSNSFLSFSLGATYTQFKIDTENFSAFNTEALPDISQGTVNFDISTLYRYERFAISFNVMNIVDKELRKELLKSDEPKKLRRFSLYPVYTHKLGTNLEIEPSLFIEYFESDGRSRTDFNVKLRRKLNDGYGWVGLSYTFLNDQFLNPGSLAPLVGLKKKNFYVAYGVGFTLNEIATFNYGTHMITLGLDFDKKISLARCTQKMGQF